MRLFALVDRAIVARVTKTGRAAAREPRARAAAAIAAGQRLVVEAVVAERVYLDGEASAVHTASARLHEAYGQLMRLYPEEGAQNRDAFFDYLCALDFL